MAFNVVLYSIRKHVNSTARASGEGVTAVCNSRSDFDVLSPVIPLEITGLNGRAPGYNWCYISAFGDRYFWIDRWTWEGGLWVAHCSVDVLATYRTAIRNTLYYVVRSADTSVTDQYVLDNTYPLTGEITHITNSAASLWLSRDNAGYVIGVVGSGGVRHYQITPANLTALGQYLFSDSFLALMDPDQLLGELGKGFVDPSQYLKSCYFCPVTLDLPTGATPIRMGWWTLSGINGVLIPAGWTWTTTRTLTIPKHPSSTTRGAYLNMAPYSQYELEVQPFGKFSLDPAKLQGATTLTIGVNFDATTGDAVMTASANGAVLVLATGTPSVPIALTQLRTNAGPMAAGAVGAAVGGPLGAAIGAVVGGLGSGSILPEPSVIGANGSWAALESVPRLTGHFARTADEDVTHLGRPVCKPLHASTLSGFIMCDRPHVDITGTRDEASQIEAYLSEGCYLE